MSVSPLKRLFLECSNGLENSPIPYKKRKRQNLQSVAIQDAIQRKKRTFNRDQLYLDRKKTISASKNNALFGGIEYNQMNYNTIRWMLACKFVIASNLKIDQYDCLGMHRNKIPTNMHFYVDQTLNICCIINHKENEKCSMSQNIIKHCNKIETCVIQSYHYISDKNNVSKLIENMIKNNDEDDDLWIDRKRTKTNHRHNHNIYHSENNEIITIIRIPMIYYGMNMNTSFYEFCCKIASQIINIEKDFSNPLFQILMQNIASFDTFQSSVPMIPLKGRLYQMFCQYALGSNNHKNVGKNKINKEEFIAFLGAYDCWKKIQYKDECRKSLYRYWTKLTGTDVNILQIVNQYSDFHEMNVKDMIQNINNFNIKEENKYLNELKEEIKNLNEIVYGLKKLF